MDNTEIKAEELREKGWIKLWCVIEALGINENVVEKSLKNLVKKMKARPNFFVEKEEYSEIKEIENPIKNVRKGYSLTVEITLLVKDIYSLLELCILYAPSAIEIFEPDEVKIKLEELQNIANLISGLMHQFASAGVGGIVIKE